MSSKLLSRTVVGLTICILPLASTFCFGNSLEEKIEDLQRQLDELKAQQQWTQEVELTQQIKKKPTVVAGPEVNLGGQYRLNFYSTENDFIHPAAIDNDKQTASRLRIRQNLDIEFDEQLKTHVQFELQHTSDNVSTTDRRRGGMSTKISVRHAVIDYTFQTDNSLSGSNARVGIVPLQDYFRQTQFSADWDYNPLAVSVIVPVGANSLRLFAANLEEGSESSARDDFVHYQGDMKIPISNEFEFVLSATALNIANAVDGGNGWHYNFGIGGRMDFDNGFVVNGSAIGSVSDQSLLGVGNDGRGVAVVGELTYSLSQGDFGILVSHASGEDDGSGFLMPMAFAGTFGYWGYTGILTVQGPTDTGFDSDGINVSNNGYGLTSVQAKYSFPITPALTGYVAAGWFGNTDAGDRDSAVGADLLAMGTYQFNKVLALDIGGAYAKLEDSVSGYFQGVQNPGGPAFNQARGEDRNKWAFFGRIQAEF
jgi:hypothetical protein